MRKVIKLSNAVFRDHNKDEKRYMPCVQVVIEQLPFALRQVFVRFANGPDLDFLIADMDRLVIGYLTARGITLPSDVLKLAKAVAPATGDFLIPNELMPESRKKRMAKRRARSVKRRKC